MDTLSGIINDNRDMLFVLMIAIVVIMIVAILGVVIYVLIKSSSNTARVESYYKEDPRLRKKSNLIVKKEEEINPFENMETTTPMIPVLQEKLERGRIPIDSNQYIIYWALIAVGGTVIGYIAGMFNEDLPSLLTALVGLICGCAAPFIYLHLAEKKMMKLFRQQLADCLPRVVSSLRAGTSLPLAIYSIAESSSEPIASEFARSKQMTDAGIPIQDTFYDMSARMGSRELVLLAQAIEIQHETGGNLSDIVEETARKIRSRLELRQMIESITAEAKLTMWITLAAPVAMFLFMTNQNETWGDFFMHSQMGWICDVIVIIAEIACWYMCQRMYNMKIEED